MIQVTSDSVKAFEWENNVLTVVFNHGDTYKYEKVPLKLYTLLMQIAASPVISFGIAFNFLIKVPGKEKYPFTKVAK